MATTTIDLKTFTKNLDKLGREGIREAAIRGLKLAALRGHQYIITTLIPKRTPPPVDKGTFRAAWYVESLPDGAMLYNNELHAIFIEYGVRGENVKVGGALIRALTEWALRKGKAADPKQAVSMAWAIAKSMQKRGIFNRGGQQGLGILKELVDQHLPRFVKEECEREIRRAIERGMGG